MKDDRKKVTDKEIFLRQWFASKYGNVFEDYGTWRLPKGIAELEREYTRDNATMRLSFNFIMYKLRDVEMEVRLGGKFELYSDQFQTDWLRDVSSVPVSREEQAATGITIAPSVVAAPVEVILNIRTLNNMEYPVFRDFPTGTVFDEIASDDDELRGFMSGMVVICTGESGVGKSTLLIDLLAKMKAYGDKRMLEVLDNDEDATEEAAKYAVNPLYVSSEMTATDLYFFKKKTPNIGNIPTLLIAEYMQRGLKEAIVKAFESPDHNVLVLDSYQDIIEKMQDVLNWRAKEAENFLIQLMVTAAEKLGKCIIAIQHLTKGGEYVGRTFLKHTTQAMMQLKFDKAGNRFIVFTKNRRGGSMTHVPLYFHIATVPDGEGKEVAFDEEQFQQMRNANEISASVAERQENLKNKFGDIFLMTKSLHEKSEDEIDLDDESQSEEARQAGATRRRRH